MSVQLFVRVEPRSRRLEDTTLVRVEQDAIENLSLASFLLKREPFTMEDVTIHLIANATIEEYGRNEEEAANAILEEVGEQFVELLNYLINICHEDLSPESTFQLTDSFEILLDNTVQEDGTDQQFALRDILTDLRHLAARRKLNFADALDGSREVYEEEVAAAKDN